MKVLVTGAAGQLGHDVIQELESRGIPCLGADVADFDLTDGDAARRFTEEYGPDVIVHCAAYTNVDRAESEPEICAGVNGMGTLNMVRAALAVGARLVYISTDYVFPGDGERPWEPEDEYGPLNVYGMSKVQGENAVRSLMTRFFILRTSWVFGINGRNFVRTMLRLGAEKPELRVVDDQVGSPTYTRDLAAVIADMIGTEKYGIYHTRNEGFLSWADFARMIMQKAGLPCRIIPVSSAEYPTPARRPLNSRLSGERLLEAGFKPLPSVENALDRYLAELAAEAAAPAP
ncbi:MAG: dTDP-4-dehydrorhamnose reductase [Clostridia bacterium]|nr:dTDP-4-dehydrorhamnose reductase [Clostridia bacterium]